MSASVTHGDQEEEGRETALCRASGSPLPENEAAGARGEHRWLLGNIIFFSSLYTGFFFPVNGLLEGKEKF